VTDNKDILTPEEELKNKRTKKLYVATIIVLCVFFVVGFAYGLNSVLAMEGSFPDMFTPLVESEISEPRSSSDVIGILNSVTDGAIEKKPALENSRSFSIDENTIESDGSDEFENALEYLSSSVEDALEDCYETKKSAFGESASAILTIPDITEQDIADFTCTYIYYQCASCGEKSDEPLEKCEACGYAFPYTKKYKDEYTIEINLNKSEKISQLFDDRTPDEIIPMLADNLTSCADITDLTVEPSAYVIYCRINRLTGKLNYLEYKKTMTVSVGIEMLGSYAQLGNKTASAEVTEKNKFSFSWPGIQLSDHTMTVEPGKSDNLLATLTCDDPTAYTVNWISSAPELVSVDDEGYFKGNKHADGESVVITASFEFQGVTYSDSCTVTVQKSVESMKFNKRNLKLSVGETFTLKAVVSPAKATFKSAGHWTSSDENIAVVDENGVVTAISSGKATITAYSEDGYFKSTCEVTVK